MIVVLVALSSAPAVARAQGSSVDDPYDVPLAPRPPTLPELTHSEMEGTIETTAGVVVPNGGGAPTHAYVQRLDLEIPLGLRRWYVGAAYELAAGTPDSSLSKAVGSNLELTGRSLWATRTGLAFGGGLAVLLPTASFRSQWAGGEVALNAASLRPWDVSLFVPSAFALRPFVDVRALYGPLVVQFRQGLDLTVSTATLGARRLYARTGLYVGYGITRHVAAGLEAFEQYAIDVPSVGNPPAAVADGARAAIVLSPNVRLSLPWVQPAISMFTNVGPPLYGAHASMWGFRLAITVVYDPAEKRIKATETAP